MKFYIIHFYIITLYIILYIFYYVFMLDITWTHLLTHSSNAVFKLLEEFNTQRAEIILWWNYKDNQYYGSISSLIIQGCYTMQ